MNWKLTAIAAATALSLVGLTAYVHGTFQPVHGFGGMMGGAGLGGLDRLDLTDEQRSQLTKIEGDLRTKNWELMGKMHDQMDDLHDLDSASGKRDRSAILAANKRMTELRQQMLENSLDATEKAEALLTPQQREQFKRYARSWRGYDRN